MNCIGCGIELQNQDKQKPGYTPRATISENEYCYRCFRLINHNETPDVPYTNEQFLHILKTIEQEDCFVIELIDFFDFNGSQIQPVQEILKNKDYMVVANKIDLIPKSVKEKKLLFWLEKQLAKTNSTPKEIMLISALRKKNIDQLLLTIDKYRKGRNVYIIGATNTGKSTLMNSIISAVTGENTKQIATSYFAGTTLNVIRVPLDDGTALIDTPGIINESQITNYLDKESLNVVVANSEIRPNTYQLQAEQVLFITGLIQMRFIKGHDTSFTTYFSNRINIHRTKLERADELFENHVGKPLLTPPTENELAKIKGFATKTLIISKQKQDIIIEGLGWITINNIDDPIIIEMVFPQKTGIHVRDSII